MKRPPFSGSSSAAKVVGAWRFGRDMKSTEPSAATSATVRPSPMAAYEPIGAKPLRLCSLRLPLASQRRIGIRAEIGLERNRRI